MFQFYKPHFKCSERTQNLLENNLIAYIFWYDWKIKNGITDIVSSTPQLSYSYSASGSLRPCETVCEQYALESSDPKTLSRSVENFGPSPIRKMLKPLSIAINLLHCQGFL